MFFSALIFVALKCMCYFWEIPEFYSSLSTVIAKNWETILKCLLFLFSNKINRNSKTNWVDEKLENLLKTMGGSKIPECHWFQPRISFPFFAERNLVKIQSTMKQTGRWCNRPPMWITVHSPSGKQQQLSHTEQPHKRENVASTKWHPAHDESDHL